MPLNLPDKLPAIELLKEENIFVIDNSRATRQDIRPLRIVILNLMPLKITTETDLVRQLSNTPLQVEISFMKIKSHTSKNTPIEQMKAFYTDFDKMRDEKYDGMIITGAPVEQMDFEAVSYTHLDVYKRQMPPVGYVVIANFFLPFGAFHDGEYEVYVRRLGWWIHFIGLTDTQDEWLHSENNPTSGGLLCLNSASPPMELNLS